MSVVIDARFAGGAIFIDEGHVTEDPTDRLVILDGPGFAISLRPHEARALAEALLAVTAQIDERKSLRRPASVDEDLRAREDV